MSFKIVTVDIKSELSDIQLSSEDVGLALDVRRGSRPVGFIMRPAAPGQRLTAHDLLKWINATVEHVSLMQPLSGPPLVGATPSITIAICTKDHPDLLRRCLQSLMAFTSDENVRVLVVDNASQSDETREVALAHHGVRYVREPIPGLNFARNRALKEATSEILAFVDDDAVADPYWLHGLRQAWARCSSAGAFTGQTLPLELRTKAQIIVEHAGGFRKGFLPVVYGQTSQTDPLYPCTTIFGNGCNMAFRTAALKQIGGFDEALDMGAYLPGGGDIDALYRIIRAGYFLSYEPQMLVRHQHRADFRGLRIQVRRSWGAGCMAFLTKIRDHDFEQSSKAKQFIKWWLRSLFTRFVRSIRRPEENWPSTLVAAELVGAIEGFFGMYGRAQRRVAKLKARY